jgi:hypothetical protein
MRLTKAQREAQAARIAAVHAEAEQALRDNTCPDCGSPVSRNLSLHGWVQCVAYPCDQMRQPQYRHLPKCEWQGFTR